MTSIDFFFNAENRLQVACRIAAKAMMKRQRLLIYAPDAETASTLDRLLWSWPATGFVPHCAPHDRLAADTPVLIAAGDETPEGFGTLLSLAAECPPHFARFDRLCELVGVDDEDRKAARGRYRFYRERGYRITDHDLAHE